MLYADYRRLLQNYPEGFSGRYGTTSAGGSLIACDKNGYPVLLFPAHSKKDFRDIELELIEVAFSRHCELLVDEQQEVSGVFTLVTLNDNDPDTAKLFLDILEDALFAKQEPLTNRQIRDTIIGISNIFCKAENRDRDIIGLWGELYIIANSGAPQAAVASWSINTTSRHDFITERFSLEVKTSRSQDRVHTFSCDQLKDSDSTLLILSLVVSEVPGGQSVSDLISLIKDQIDDPLLRTEFLKLCASKGGKTVMQSQLTLSVKTKPQGLRIFASSDIPRPDIPDGAPISHVRFDVTMETLVDKALKMSLKDLDF